MKSANRTHAATVHTRSSGEMLLSCSLVLNGPPKSDSGNSPQWGSAAILRAIAMPARVNCLVAFLPSPTLSRMPCSSR